MKRSSAFASHSRRNFVKSTALASAGLFLPAGLIEEFGSCFVPVPDVTSPLRVRGRVQAQGKGLGKVAVSDGRSVTVTQADGSYELVTDTSRPFVFVCLPAGYEIPTNAPGTANFYHALRPGAKGEARADFSLEPARAADTNHQFLVLADPQMQNSYETGLFHSQTIPDVQATLRAYANAPTFGIGCGDLLFDDLSLYPDYEKGIRKLGIPFFQVIGNHDLDLKVRSDEASDRTFGQYFGPTYYSFNRGDVHYVVLDDVFFLGAGYIGYLHETQLQWLEADLALVEKGRTVVVALHIPSSGTREKREGKAEALGNTLANRQELYRLLEPYRAHLLSGHTHESEHTFEGNRHEHVNGAVCGAWWSGPICWDGTPNGYSVYEVKGESLQWRHKSVGFEATHQMRLYAPGSEGNPNELVVNVWGWDPAWKVFWYEGADRKGAMTPRKGLDPLSVKLHTGDKLPERRPWVDPVPTDHLFYAPVSANAKGVRVEAVDRWGKSHSATLG